MISQQFILPISHEITVDLFAGADGRVLPKDAQVRMCGNSVCPPLAAAIVRSNYSDSMEIRRAA